jgi:hypothetical protein
MADGRRKQPPKEQAASERLPPIFALNKNGESFLVPGWRLPVKSR